MPRFGIVAGEASGDFLGAGLINSIRKLIPDAVFEGIGGPLMEQAGCRVIYPMEKLAVMGLVEIIGKYRELAGIRNQLTEYFIQQPPDVFIGVDAPDFNLELEHRLHGKNIKTVHYVSPSVWAWREYRLNKISRAVDLMLVLFPFEKTFYEEKGIPVVFAGHPLAEKINIHPDQAEARKKLNLPQEDTLVAIMPGSRKMELNRLLEPFLLAANHCLKKNNQLRFVTSLLTQDSIRQFNETVARLALDHLPVSIYQDSSHAVLEAADVILMASGTITLEAMLLKKPMVVAYKMNWMTYAILKALVKVRYAALPNLLLGTEIVPECLQSECTPGRLQAEIMNWLENPAAITVVQEQFAQLHRTLIPERNDVAAQAVLDLLD